MSKTRFELSYKGMRELLKSQQMVSVCANRANDIANRAGAGYRVTTNIGSSRAHASVITATKKAMKDNLENNTLLKAVR